MSAASPIAPHHRDEDMMMMKHSPNTPTSAAAVVPPPPPPTSPASIAETLLVAVLGNADRKYRVPLSRLLHVPTTPHHSRVLCPFYDPQHPNDSCTMGSGCHHVHADVRGLVMITAHVNYAWRSIADVTYPRHAAGQLVRIAAPNTVTEVDVMDTGSLLVTKALESNRRPLTHCAHYYLNRRCNLGPDCRFVHAVFVNENARPRQRAPAPVLLGRKRVSRRPSGGAPLPSEHPEGAVLTAPAAAAAEPFAAGIERSHHTPTEAPASPPPPPSSGASSSATQPPSSPVLLLSSSGPSFHDASADGSARWKHNPYSAVS